MPLYVVIAWRNGDINEAGEVHSFHQHCHLAHDAAATLEVDEPGCVAVVYSVCID